MSKDARVVAARAWPVCDDTVCILARSPGDSSWPGRTGVQGRLRVIVEEQAGE